MVPAPPRPTGANGEARFAQAVWDALWGAQRPSESAGIRTSRTTRGTHRIPFVQKMPMGEREGQEYAP